jgi:Uma2 family endonuclease
MSTLSPRRVEPSTNGLPLLVNGDRMKQPEFHRRYEAYPEDVKFELVGGVVYMASPLRLKHSDYDDEVGYILGTYRRATPGVQVLRNATTILGEESEPQPDLGLRVLPEYGGRSRTTDDDYVEGPPELLVEISYSTRALDMHAKRDDYRQTGVLEYLVVCVEEKELYWFAFPEGRRLAPDRQGVYRSRVFPGLWIDGPALLRLDSARVGEVLQQGLASRLHAAFVKRLAKARRGR